MTIAELRALLSRATPGPWRWQDSYGFHEHISHQDDGLEADCENIQHGRIELVSADGVVLNEWAAHADDSGLSVSMADAALIAAAVNALPAMLDAMEAAGEVVDADVGAMHFANEESCRRFNDAINGLRAAVAKWREG